MMINRPIYILLILVFAFLSCSKVKQPVFRTISALKFKNIGSQKAEVVSEVIYYNPNNFGASVRKAVVDVYLDSIHMGQFTQAVEVEVEKKADFRIPLLGTIPVAKALQLKVGDVLNNEIRLNVNSTVEVGKGGIFVTRKVAYNGKHKLDLRL